MSDDEDQYSEQLIVSEDLIQSPTHKEAATRELDFNGLLQHVPLKLHEDLSTGNGGQAWPAGVCLAKYLLRTKRDELKTKVIVELGAGGGLVGLAVAAGCRPQHALHITDQRQMLPLMQRNIELNGLGERVKASVYAWGDAPPDDIPSSPDVILAADCVYFEPAFPLLQKTLQDLIGPRSVCYFCFKKRRRADMQFMKVAKKMFEVQDVEDDPDHETWWKESIFL